jgi:hypothetical protein
MGEQNRIYSFSKIRIPSGAQALRGWARNLKSAINWRPLKNVHFCSSSRKAEILTTDIH